MCPLWSNGEETFWGFVKGFRWSLFFGGLRDQGRRTSPRLVGMAVSEVAADDLSLVSRRQFISEAPSAVLLLATSRYLSGFEDKSFQTQRIHNHRDIENKDIVVAYTWLPLHSKKIFQ
ncbi:unnamed protein product [Brassica oleracea var. botrytis]|uniref:(rape) hypothetical protein n=1 Tax=Brassica napus TaxID=3708 RepID=A0A816IYJ1_BRANA|nr:PREDICTED: uncharacterized protein LOC106313983 isoform X2 [Brassica oleracea var. oleracea]XP_013712679.1 uncharacterized protein BNAC09G23290D isoform X1 [Brassica napus]CAF1743011.1 unnamed protein product [Brassica napus]